MKTSVARTSVLTAVVVVLLIEAVLYVLSLRTEWYIFIADPFVFAQAFVLMHWSARSRRGFVVPLLVSYLYLALLALIFPIPYVSTNPVDVNGVLEYSPGISELVHFPLLLLFVVLPVAEKHWSKRERQYSLSRVLWITILVSVTLTFLTQVAFGNSSLGAVIWKIYKATMHDPFTLLQVLLWMLYLVDGWIGVATLRVHSLWQRTALMSLVSAATALCHLMAFCLYHGLAVIPVVVTFYHRLFCLHAVAATSVAWMVAATAERAEETGVRSRNCSFSQPPDVAAKSNFG